MSASISQRTSCLPCCQGEHEHCRHRNDGPEYGRSDGPCVCEQQKHTLGVGTCSDMRMRDGWSYSRCGKPAKGKVVQRATFGPTRRPGLAPEVEVERCGVHLAALRRMADNEERRRAEWAARDAADERARQLSAASAEWAERLRDEFGVHAEPTRPRDGRLHVLVEPEHLFGMLDAWRVELLAVGVDPSELT